MKVHGPIVDMLKAACKNIQRECEFRTAPWKRIMTSVRRGKYEGCFVFGENEKRKAWAHYTTPLVKTEYGFFYLDKKQDPITKLSQLKGKTIVVHQKSNTHKELLSLQRIHNKSQLDFHIHTTLDIETALNMFANNRFEKDTYLFGNKDILLHMAKSLSYKTVRYSLKHSELNYHIGLSKKAVSDKLFNELNSALKIFKEQEQYQKLLAQYGVFAPKD